MSHVTCQWVMSHVNESCHTWMRHVACKWVMSHVNESCHIHRKNSLEKTPFAYNIFFEVSNRGPSVRHGVFCGAPSAAAKGLRQVARHMHNPNVIIGARSASQLAPDSVAAMGNECLCSSASLPSHCNQKYTMRSNIFVLDRILSQSGT